MTLGERAASERLLAPLLPGSSRAMLRFDFRIERGVRELDLGASSTGEKTQERTAVHFLFSKQILLTRSGWVGEKGE